MYLYTYTPIHYTYTAIGKEKGVKDLKQIAMYVVRVSFAVFFRVLLTHIVHQSILSCL